MVFEISAVVPEPYEIRKLRRRVEIYSVESVPALRSTLDIRVLRRILASVFSKHGFGSAAFEFVRLIIMFDAVFPHARLSAFYLGVFALQVGGVSEFFRTGRLAFRF